MEQMTPCVAFGCDLDAIYSFYVVEGRRCVSAQTYCLMHGDDEMVRRCCEDRFHPLRSTPVSGMSELGVSFVVYEKNSMVGRFFMNELGGTKTFMIPTGILEVREIIAALHQQQSSRPTSHDLTMNIIDASGGKLECVLISDYDREKAIYLGLVRISKGEEVIDVDARVSDAVVLALKGGAPIWIPDRVFAEVFPPR